MAPPPNRSGAPALSHARTPAARVSMPDYVDWHMILDAELSHLSAPETGILGSVGFTALGGAVGLLPSFLEAKDKIGTVPLPTNEFVQICAFVGCFALAVVCLIIFGLRVYRNRSLAAKIRARPKQEN